MSTAVFLQGQMRGMPTDARAAQAVYDRLHAQHGTAAEAREGESFDGYVTRMCGDGLLFQVAFPASPWGRLRHYRELRAAEASGAVLLDEPAPAAPAPPTTRADAERLLGDPAARAARLTEIMAPARPATLKE